MDGHEQLAVEVAKEHPVAIVVGRDGQWFVLPGAIEFARRGVGNALHIASAVPTCPYHAQTTCLCAEQEGTIGHRTGVPRCIVCPCHHHAFAHGACHVWLQFDVLDGAVAILYPFVAVDEVALAIGVFEIRGIERGLLCGHVGVFSAADEGVFAFGQSALQDVNSASRMTVAVDGDSAVGKC